MSDIPSLPLSQLKLVVSDPQELAKGMAIADKGGIRHLARYGNKLFADADGSGAAPYKAQIVHDEKGYRGRCSCMAARSRPFCKHAAALLVAWARDPAGFAISEAPLTAPPATGGESKRAKPKTGKVDAQALMRQGIDQTLSLVRELALSGISTLGAERVAQIRALAETLRAERLRRLSASLLELAQLLDVAVADFGMLDSEAYADALIDISLTARRIARHLDGAEALKPEYVETLIGKTWTKKDRSDAGSLDLIEYAFIHSVTADDYVIRESRLVDLASGSHYSEKQILPAFLAKRSTPKRSYAGFVLRGAGGGRYPGFAPIRLDLANEGEFDEPRAGDYARLLASALPGVGAALSALLEARKDVFGADSVPVAIRLDSLYAEGERLFALDANGESLLIAGGDAAVTAVTQALAMAELRCVLGDMLLVGAMPCLNPLALLVRRAGRDDLLPLPAPDATALLRQRKRSAGRRERWIDSARELGMGAAALTLGEAREELADILAEGLSALVPRRVDGLVARLQSLSLVKPAALLAEVAQRADPGEKLDDAIRLLQVLGIGLTRLASNKKVERSALARSPLHPAIEVLPPTVDLDAAGLIAELGAGRLQGHSRAIAIDRALASFDAETLAQMAPILFADGSVCGLVARRYAAHPELAIGLARQVLLATAVRERRWTVEAAFADHARIAKLSAICVLQALATPPALDLLRQYRDQRRPDPALKAMASWVLDPDRAPGVHQEFLDGLHAGSRDERIRALQKIGENGAIAAIHAVRLLAVSDPSVPVRHCAWATLALLLDVGIVPMLIAQLRERHNDDDAGREAAHALGLLGDSRAIGPLLDAFADGFKPAILADSLRAIGAPVLPALIARIDAQPEIAERKAAQEIAIGVGIEATRDCLAARLQHAPIAELAAMAQRYLKLAGGNAQLKLWLADAIEARAIRDGEVSAEVKRLLNRARTPPKAKAKT